MSRPIKENISSGLENWDTKVDSNFDTILSGPLPIFQVLLAEALPDPTTFDRCILMHETPAAVWTMKFSDGVSWISV